MPGRTSVRLRQPLNPQISSQPPPIGLLRVANPTDHSTDSGHQKPLPVGNKAEMILKIGFLANSAAVPKFPNNQRVTMNQRKWVLRHRGSSVPNRWIAAWKMLAAAGHDLSPEMLRQLEALGLVVRPDALAVQRVGL